MPEIFDGKNLAGMEILYCVSWSFMYSLLMFSGKLCILCELVKLLISKHYSHPQELVKLQKTK